MMLNDWQIDALCHPTPGIDIRRMIEPYINHKVSNNFGVPCLSYGRDGFGYDIRMSSEGIRTIKQMAILDPLDVDEAAFPFVHPDRIRTNKFGRYIDLFPNEAILGRSVEHFNIPPTVKVICLGKSSYARMAVLNLTTPAEAGWHGYLTIEVVNTSQAITRIYLDNHGIISMLFLQGSLPTTLYGDGKYQGQGKEVVLPRAPESGDVRAQKIIEFGDEPDEF